MKIPPTNKSRALTLIEVLVILAIVAVLAALLLPALVGAKSKHQRINCINGLKQVGLGFQIWSRDHIEKFPMQVSINIGGTMELVGNPDNTFRHFLVMSNWLCTPKILQCPNDPARFQANTFVEAAKPDKPELVPFESNNNLSYFVGVDATKANAGMFLSGDRNITNDAGISNGLLHLATNQPARWTREMHDHKGNICLADGSVQFINNTGLRPALESTAVATNRLALP